MEVPGSRTVLPEVRYHPSITGPARRAPAARAVPPAPRKPLADRAVPPAPRGPTAPRPQGRWARSQSPDAGQKSAGSVQPTAPGEKLDVARVKEVEILTRGQRDNPDWFAWRQHRITASVAHRIAHSRFANGKSKIPPTSYLSAITGKGSNVQTRAMKWGVTKEAVAVRSYEGLKSREQGRPVVVQACGLFIDAQRPWLAASPDGVMTDGRSGQRLLLLEVKCPYKHRERTVQQACQDDPAFCLERTGHAPPQYRVKPGHSYYTQVQMQMAVCGLHQADFVVYTLRETVVAPVTFDPAFWEDTLARLEVFYRDAILPHTRHAPEL